MFIRIVKMSFFEKEVDGFLNIFEAVKSKIRHFEGCQFLELYRDKNNPSVFFTYSYWNTEADLENYRRSKLFEDVWGQTKKLFNAPAQAWSVDKVVSMN